MTADKAESQSFAPNRSKRPSKVAVDRQGLKVVRGLDPLPDGRTHLVGNARVVPGALECLAELGWRRAEAVRAPDGARPSRRFHINPRLAAGAVQAARGRPSLQGGR